MRRSLSGGRVLVAGGVALTLVTLSIGCSSMRTAVEKAKDWAVTDPPLPQRSFATGLQPDDLPIPPGYTLQPTRSFVHRHGMVRVAGLEYLGSVGIEPTVQFILTQWPPQGWSVETTAGVGSRRELRLLKGHDACTVTLSTAEEVTTLNISIGYH
ncbi:MAG: hypothetical protein HYY93_08850 [Planctomycetes bacterium]|nr:hypothetical protein [Planctomycetota bacterium]